MTTTVAGVYVGSFDPPHVGHEAIVLHVLQRRLVDHVYICGNNPNNSKPDRLPYAVRRRMLKYIFDDVQHVTVVDDDVDTWLARQQHKQEQSSVASSSDVELPEATGLNDETLFYGIIGSDVFEEYSKRKRRPKLGRTINRWIVICRGLHAPKNSGDDGERYRQIVQMRTSCGVWDDDTVLFVDNCPQQNDGLSSTRLRTYLQERPHIFIEAASPYDNIQDTQQRQALCEVLHESVVDMILLEGLYVEHFDVFTTLLTRWWFQSSPIQSWRRLHSPLCDTAKRTTTVPSEDAGATTGQEQPSRRHPDRWVLYSAETEMVGVPGVVCKAWCAHDYYSHSHGDTTASPAQQSPPCSLHAIDESLFATRKINSPLKRWRRGINAFAALRAHVKYPILAAPSPFITYHNSFIEVVGYAKTHGVTVGKLWRKIHAMSVHHDVGSPSTYHQRLIDAIGALGKGLSQLHHSEVTLYGYRPHSQTMEHLRTATAPTTIAHRYWQKMAREDGVNSANNSISTLPAETMQRFLAAPDAEVCWTHGDVNLDNFIMVMHRNRDIHNHVSDPHKQQAEQQHHNRHKEYGFPHRRSHSSSSTAHNSHSVDTSHCSALSRPNLHSDTSAQWRYTAIQQHDSTSSPDLSLGVTASLSQDQNNDNTSSSCHTTAPPDTAIHNSAHDDVAPTITFVAIDLDKFDVGFASYEYCQFQSALRLYQRKWPIDEMLFQSCEKAFEEQYGPIRDGGLTLQFCRARWRLL